MPTLDDVMEIAGREQFLAVVSTSRADSTIQSSLVNAGVLGHPITGEPVLAFVTYGASQAAQPQSPTADHGHVSIRVEMGHGRGPSRADRPRRPRSRGGCRASHLVLREIFVAAGGQHDDWDAYDDTMLEQRRTAIFVQASRIYSN